MSVQGLFSTRRPRRYRAAVALLPLAAVVLALAAFPVGPTEASFTAEVKAKTNIAATAATVAPVEAAYCIDKERAHTPLIVIWKASDNPPPTGGGYEVTFSSTNSKALIPSPIETTYPLVAIPHDIGVTAGVTYRISITARAHTWRSTPVSIDAILASGAQKWECR